MLQVKHKQLTEPGKTQENQTIGKTFKYYTHLQNFNSLYYNTYSVMEEDHQKSKADEDNQGYKQDSSHHGEVILIRERY